MTKCKKNFKKKRKKRNVAKNRPKKIYNEKYQQIAREKTTVHRILEKMNENEK